MDAPRDAGGMDTPRDAGGMGAPRDAGGMGAPRDAGGMGAPRDAGGMGAPRDAAGMRRGFHLEPHIAAERESRALDAAIATLATRQHGVISREQLEGIGLTRHEIGDRIRAKRLHPLHRGVYAVGHRKVSREGRYLAAVLASGEGAVLSHCSAADLWELRATKEREIDVIARTHRRGDQ